MTTSTVLYILNHTNNSRLCVIQPGTINGPGNTAVADSTDLFLYGNDTPQWGQNYNDNFVRLLENFAVPEQSGTLFVPQNQNTLGAGYGINNPLTGQVYYNLSRNQLFVQKPAGSGNSAGWGPVTSALTVSSVSPSSLDGLSYVPTNGDLVFNTSTNALMVYNSGTWYSSTGSVVTSLIAGTGITLSGSTGNVTISTVGSGTVTSVGIVGSTGLNVSGSPITTTGTISLQLSNELQGLSTLGSTGMVTRIGSGTYTARAITGGTGISVSNGTGITGNPTVSLGIVPISNGGTGQTNGISAFNALAPVGTIGTLIIGGSSGYTALGTGSEGQVLVAAPSSNPAYGVKWFSSFSHAQTGYEKLPSGLIFQWGFYSANNSSPSVGDFNISFPIAFASQCFSVTCSTMRNVSSEGQAIDGSNFVSNVSNTGCTLTLDLSNGGATHSGYWIAIGV